MEMDGELDGDGSPPVVLVHGFACDRTDWAAQVKALSACHRVVTCDLRGHGSTPGEPQDCSIETYGADCAELVVSRVREGKLIGHREGVTGGGAFSASAAVKAPSAASAKTPLGGTGGVKSGAGRRSGRMLVRIIAGAP